MEDRASGYGPYLFIVVDVSEIGVDIGWLFDRLAVVLFRVRANTIQSESALTGICLMMSIFPAIATGISALFISRYPLSEKRLSEISSDLENRREIAEQNKI